MKLLTANRYYALNDRTIHLLSQGEVDMSATTSAVFIDGGAEKSVSDAEVEDSLILKPKVKLFVIDKNENKSWRCLFQILKVNIIQVRRIWLI